MILSPHSDLYNVRKEITKLGYKIEKEIIMYDQKKPYIVIKFVKGNETYSDDELFFGPILLKDKNESFYKFYQQLNEKNKDVLKKIPNDNAIKLELELMIKKIDNIIK